MVNASTPPNPAASASPQENASETPDQPGETRARRDELIVFLIICVVLFPTLTVALVGLYGLIVWISHMLGG